jgi:hypothetical protein
LTYAFTVTKHGNWIKPNADFKKTVTLRIILSAVNVLISDFRGVYVFALRQFIIQKTMSDIFKQSSWWCNWYSSDLSAEIVRFIRCGTCDVADYMVTRKYVVIDSCPYFTSDEFSGVTAKTIRAMKAPEIGDELDEIGGLFLTMCPHYDVEPYDISDYKNEVAIACLENKLPQKPNKTKTLNLNMLRWQHQKNTEEYREKIRKPASIVVSGVSAAAVAGFANNNSVLGVALSALTGFTLLKMLHTKN